MTTEVYKAENFRNILQQNTNKVPAEAALPKWLISTKMMEVNDKGIIVELGLTQWQARNFLGWLMDETVKAIKTEGDYYREMRRFNAHYCSIIDSMTAEEFQKRRIELDNIRNIVAVRCARGVDKSRFSERRLLNTQITQNLSQNIDTIETKGDNKSLFSNMKEGLGKAIGGR